MSRQRIWIVNAVLCGLLVWGAMRFRSEWNAFGASHQAALLANAPVRTAVKAPAEEASVAATEVAWTEIASRSPFSFDRTDVNLDLAEPVAAPVSGPKPVLLGTLLLGNERLALMGKAGADGRSGSRVKIGETFEGWQVVDIQDSAVIVTSNGARESISVGRAPVMRSSEKTSAPAPAPVANSVTAPPAAPASRPAAIPSGNNGLLGLGTRAPRPEPPPGHRVVETPFGWKIEQDTK
jgi:hypothetical protein